MRSLVLEETKRTKWFRCMIGSAPSPETVFVWFPLDVQHLEGRLSVPLFDRIIDTYNAVIGGDLSRAETLSANIVC